MKKTTFTADPSTTLEVVLSSSKDETAETAEKTRQLLGDLGVLGGKTSFLDISQPSF